jgi:hypothetical protein
METGTRVSSDLRDGLGGEGANSYVVSRYSFAGRPQHDCVHKSTTHVWYLLHSLSSRKLSCTLFNGE